MTPEEKRQTFEAALRSATENGATLTSMLLKAAEDTAKKDMTLFDKYDEMIDKPLYGWGEKNFGRGMGNYAATGGGMAGLGALYGLLFGDKKKGTWDAILNNALLFGALGLGGQYLRNNMSQPTATRPAATPQA